MSLDPVYEQVLIAKLEICQRMYRGGDMSKSELASVIEDVERKVATERSENIRPADI